MIRGDCAQELERCRQGEGGEDEEKETWDRIGSV
jgi:hypothetical protein